MEFKYKTDGEFLRDFVSILRSEKSKNNTYKFALARFLLDHSRRSNDPMVRFSKLAKFFFKYYWLQECKSKIRQGPPHQTPKIITIIRTRFYDKTYPQTFDKICEEQPEDVRWCVSQITRYCFRDVIHRFHHSIDGEKIFFDYFAKHYTKSGNAYIDRNGGIRINPNAMRFFDQYYEVLYRTVILEWIRFIEKRNLGLPHLVDKIYRRKKVLSQIMHQCYQSSCGLIKESFFHRGKRIRSSDISTR